MTEVVAISSLYGYFTIGKTYTFLDKMDYPNSSGILYTICCDDGHKRQCDATYFESKNKADFYNDLKDLINE